MLLDNSEGYPHHEEVLSLLHKCNLDKPYLCCDKTIVLASNIGFYYSTVYLILCSDALLYESQPYNPATFSKNITNVISSDTKIIHLSEFVKSMPADAKRKNNSERLIKSLLSVTSLKL